MFAAAMQGGRRELMWQQCYEPSNNMTFFKPGKETETAVIQMFDGHYFGELALIYGEPRTASIRADGEVRRVMC